MKTAFSAVLFLSVLVLALLFLLRGPVQRVEVEADPERTTRKQAISEFWLAYRQATAARSQGDFATAAAFYRSALLINETHEDSLYYLGNCFLELGEARNALLMYQRITELNPQSHRGFSQAGNVLSSLEPGSPVDFDEARENYEKSTRINPEESGPFIRLGLLAYREGRIGEALQHLNTAEGFRSPEAHFLNGALLYQQGRYPEAAERFLRALEIDQREQAIAGRGLATEGNLAPSRTDAGPSPPAAAAVKSLVFLHWTAAALGEPPDRWDPGYRMPVPQTPLAVRDSTARLGRKAQELGRGAWADYDRDGDADLAVVGAGGSIHLFQNEQGRFSEVASRFGLGGAQGVWDLVWGDYDGDGRPDLYALRAGFVGEGQNTLYRNRESGFEDVTGSAGLIGRRATTRALFWDYNGDGLLDLLETGSAGSGFGAVRLYRNMGGRFQEFAEQAGLTGAEVVVDAASADFDGDGRPDLLMVPWRGVPLLYRNGGNEQFVSVNREVGLPDTPAQSYSGIFLDFNNDQRPDLLLTRHASYDSALQSLLYPEAQPGEGSLRLFLNEDGSRFREVTLPAGLTKASGVMQVVSADVDGDGYSDLVLANGGLDPYRMEPSVVLLNREGRRFETAAFLPAFDRPANATGAAAVVDGNGCMEIYLAGAGLFSFP